MKRILLIATLLVASAWVMSSCQKAAPGVNDAIYDLVLELKPTSVDEFMYNGGKVYHFDTWRGPDDMTRLYSADGELLAFFGGFLGTGDGRCTDFSETAVFVRTVYANGQWIRGK
jgi:hypothetical protein